MVVGGGHRRDREAAGGIGARQDARAAAPAAESGTVASGGAWLRRHC